MRVLRRFERRCYLVAVTDAGRSGSRKRGSTWICGGVSQTEGHVAVSPRRLRLSHMERRGFGFSIGLVVKIMGH
jgi:hypothetical protein